MNAKTPYAGTFSGKIEPPRHNDMLIDFKDALDGMSTFIHSVHSLSRVDERRGVASHSKSGVSVVIAG
ncbi:hypothetical protein DV096_19650 [Bradymonadaceae bacterium TMQ3]|nr:hypothetical protein DV096_19650 [Bradymonadaceae bacterium TMQ3]